MNDKSLTAAEEATLREQIVDLRRFPAHTAWANTVGALLATLDRDRALSAPTPEAAGLRERIEALIERYENTGTMTGHAAAWDLRAALASTEGTSKSEERG